MSGAPDLSLDEHRLLRAALGQPIPDTDPEARAICLRLAARGLMQRAGGIAIVNGWHGSPQAFVLTRDGWAAITAQRRTPPMRRAG